MSKPLVLVWRRDLPAARLAVADIIGFRKHLSQAELAAEYWKANSEGWCAEVVQVAPENGKYITKDERKYRVDVLERFVQSPQYNEPEIEGVEL